MSLEFDDLTAEDTDGLRQARAAAEYATVVVTIGPDPDNPTKLAPTVVTYPGVPCYLTVAEALVDIAAEFERQHGPAWLHGPGCGS